LSVLSVIGYAGPITAGQLARAEQVRPPTVTRLVQALVRAGLVRRRRDPDDARVVQLEATAAGARLLATARRRRVRALARELDQLSRQELRALRATLDALERRFPRDAARSAPSARVRRQ
jgi:DNA-binding MarR family transcriptional regulator